MHTVTGFGIPPLGPAHDGAGAVHWPPPLVMAEAERSALEDAIANGQVPHSLRCSITHEVMLQPAVVNGHCFERDPIAQWLAEHRKDPISRRPARVSDLRPDYTVREHTGFLVEMQVHRKRGGGSGSVSQ